MAEHEEKKDEQSPAGFDVPPEEEFDYDEDEDGGDPVHERGVTPLSIVREIVINMSVLMFAAIIMISFMINSTNQYFSGEHAKYAPLFIIPYIIIFGVVVAVFGGRLISKVILTPLKQLNEATGKVADGDLTTRVHITENVEMHQLAISFNRMTAKLHRNRRQLEDNLDELRRLNENLSRTQRELLSTEKLASVGRLAAGVAHEIGNPLSSMSGYLEILSRRDYLSEADRDMLGRVQSEVVRINEIIKELLDYSRPQDASREKFNLNDSIESALTLLSGHKGSEKVEIWTSLGDIPLVYANRSAAKQLIMNLVINSLQAMPDAGKIEIATEPLEQDGVRGVELSVSDTGPGIPEDQLEQIFDPFFTTKEPGQGTGLGLSICLRIVENMKGKIWAQSGPGQGAVFKAWIPAVD